MYRKKSIEKYLDDLAAKLPAPGGGSAAALSAGLGVSLIEMVVNFTLGKPKYAEYESELNIIIYNAERMRKRFIELVDLDVLAFKSKDMDKALCVPLEICRLCYEAIKLCPPLMKKGNRNLVSDVAVASILIESAFSGALFNVAINLKYLGDKTKTEKINRELSKKKIIIIKTREDLEAKINEIIRG